MGNIHPEGIGSSDLMADQNNNTEVISFPAVPKCSGPVLFLIDTAGVRAHTHTVEFFFLVQPGCTGRTDEVGAALTSAQIFSKLLSIQSALQDGFGTVFQSEILPDKLPCVTPSAGWDTVEYVRVATFCM